MGRLAQGERSTAFRNIIKVAGLEMMSFDEPMENTRARGKDLESHGCARHAPATHLRPRVQPVAGSGFLTVAQALLGERLAIGFLAVIGGGHENDALLLIDLVKEAPIAHSVAPSWRVPIFQSFDIRTGMRGLAKNRVNVITKLGFEPPL